MTKEEIKFLEDNRHHYTTFVKAGFIQNLTNEVRQNLLSIIHAHFAPGYLCCLHCNEDVAKMLVYVYTQYDKMPKEETKKTKTKTKA